MFRHAGNVCDRVHDSPYIIECDCTGVPAANWSASTEPSHWEKGENTTSIVKPGDVQTAVAAWKVSCERCDAGAAFLREKEADTFKRNHPHSVEKTPLGPVVQNATDR